MISALFKTEQILVSRVSKIGGERLRVSDSLPLWADRIGDSGYGVHVTSDWRRNSV